MSKSSNHRRKSSNSALYRGSRSTFSRTLSKSASITESSETSTLPHFDKHSLFKVNKVRPGHSKQDIIAEFFGVMFDDFTTEYVLADSYFYDSAKSINQHSSELYFCNLANPDTLRSSSEPMKGSICPRPDDFRKKSTQKKSWSLTQKSVEVSKKKSKDSAGIRFTDEDLEFEMDNSNNSRNSNSNEDLFYYRRKDTSLASFESQIEMYMKFKNGNQYEGQVKHKLMHGLGTFIWADGTIYKGEFKFGFPCGSGTMTLPDLSRYEGTFYNGTFHGTGSFRISSTSMVYSGEWYYGKKQGTGWLMYRKNNWYHGEWFKDERHGEGFRHYANGSKYKGNWDKNIREGDGTMVFGNNDIYKGAWLDNTFHGYGEYTWDAILSKSLVYPLNPSYKGNWCKGLREGVGVLVFGNKSGATYIGALKENQKHGAGVMVCGNGLVLQSNPLFLNDKPLNNKSLINSECGDGKLISVRELYRKIYAKKISESFDEDSLKVIASHNLEKKYFVQLATSARSKTIFNPLKIPIHNITENIDIAYYIQQVLRKYSDVYKVPKKSISDPEEVKLQIDSALNEEKEMRSCILYYLEKITEIYEKYSENNSKFRTALMRIHLWQFYSNLKLPERGISLIQSDLILYENPVSCVESKHDPFEPLYFWQFLLSLIGVALKLFELEQFGTTTPKTGILTFIMTNFFEELVNLDETDFRKFRVLEEFKDLLPLNSVYALYLELGEALPARSFLAHCCVKADEEPPCYFGVNFAPSMPKNGSIATFGQDVCYIYDKVKQIAEQFKDNKVTDEFSCSLFAFRSLGIKQLIKCIVEVCPSIEVDGLIIDMDYQLTFLEFYEILVNCAVRMIEIEIKEIEEQRRIEKEKEQAEELRRSTLTVISPSLKTIEGKTKGKKRNK